VLAAARVVLPALCIARVLVYNRRNAQTPFDKERSPAVTERKISPRLALTACLAFFAAALLFMGCSSRAEALGAARFVFAGTHNDADCAVLTSGSACVVIDTGEEEDGEKLIDEINAEIEKLAKAVDAGINNSKLFI